MVGLHGVQPTSPSHVFHKKLNKFLQETHIDLVTVDAENTNHSTNFNFVEDLVPIFSYHKIGMVIIKMFHECDLEDLIDKNLVAPYYNRFFFKLILSNPVGTECLLVLLSDDLNIPEGVIMSLNKWWTTCKQYLKPDSGMTRLQMIQYLETAREMTVRLRTLCPSPAYRCADKHSWHVQTSKVCGVLCCNHIHDIMDTIDIVHNGYSEDLFKIVPRAGGVNEVLLSMCCDLVTILGFNNHSHQMVDVIIKLDQFIVRDIQAVRDGVLPFLRVSMGEGDFFTRWGRRENIHERTGLQEAVYLHYNTKILDKGGKEE